MKTNQTNETVIYELEAGVFQWEIAPGKIVEAWGFNRQLPGPILKARKGDTLVVKVKNNLEEPTTIHWHGIRLPAQMDGTGEVQQPIEPGTEFEYRFIVPDAGTFWYHSHFNETVQLERGLYGALIVEDEQDPVTDEDRVLMIDDMKLTNDNRFTEPGWFMPRLIERHDGREGDTLLINGRENPVIRVHAGQTERWRLINASSARYFRFHLEGRPFRIIGTDGGLLEKPVERNEILIVPGERMDILAGPFRDGESFHIESLTYSRMTFRKARNSKFAEVQVIEEKPSIAIIPAQLRRIEILAPKDAAVTRKIKFSVGPSLKNGMDFMVNNAVHVNDQPVRVGELEVWELENVSMMDHPYHLHGFFFQVIEINGKEPAWKAWKDTINLPPKSRIKIAWMPDNRPGIWMYHCHILEHHAAGMMANFQVVDGEKPIVPLTGHHH